MPYSAGQEVEQTFRQETPGVTRTAVHRERPIFTPQEGVHVVTAVRAVVVNPEALGL